MAVETNCMKVQALSFYAEACNCLNSVSRKMSIFCTMRFGTHTKSLFCIVTLSATIVMLFPKHFYFAIMPLRLDCGLSRMEVIDSLRWWHLTTLEFKWTVLNRPIFTIFVKTDCMASCLIFIFPTVQRTTKTLQPFCQRQWCGCFGLCGIVMKCQVNQC